MAERDLGERVRDHVVAVSDALGLQGSDAAALLEPLDAARNDDEVVVVVAGEQGRGKSLLINALIGRRDLLPTGPRVTTGCHVLVRGGVEAGAWAHGLEPEPAAIDLSAVDTWVRAGEPGADGRPTHVEVAVDAPVLGDGLILVDTPGVGGLEAVHTAITLRVLHDADTVIFVVDARGPVTESEIDFLGHASERVRSVLFVVTKTDLHPGWREIVAADREILASRVPRLADAPWYPTSGLLALDAVDVAEGGHDAFAAELDAVARLDPLRDALRELATRPARQLRMANALYGVAVALAPIIAVEEDRATATLRADDERKVERDRLTASRDALDASERDLQQQVAGVARELRERSLAELEKAFDRVAADGRAGAFGKTSSDIADLARDVDAAVARTGDDLSADLLGRGQEAHLRIVAASGRDHGSAGDLQRQVGQSPQAMPRMPQPDERAVFRFLRQVRRHTAAAVTAVNIVQAGTYLVRLEFRKALETAVGASGHDAEISGAEDARTAEERGHLERLVERTVDDARVEMRRRVDDLSTAIGSVLAEEVAEELSQQRRVLIARIDDLGSRTILDAAVREDEARAAARRLAPLRELDASTVALEAEVHDAAAVDAAPPSESEVSP